MSKIQWTEKTWNPVVRCTKISARMFAYGGIEFPFRFRGVRRKLVLLRDSREAE
jgi:protein gp37